MVIRLEGTGKTKYCISESPMAPMEIDTAFLLNLGTFFEGPSAKCTVLAREVLRDGSISDARQVFVLFTSRFQVSRSLGL